MGTHLGLSRQVGRNDSLCWASRGSDMRLVWPALAVRFGLLPSFRRCWGSVVVHHDMVWGDSDNDTLVARHCRERLHGVLVGEVLDHPCLRIVAVGDATEDRGMTILLDGRGEQEAHARI